VEITSTSSESEASPISLAEVAEVVKKLFSGKAPGVDEIRLEMLKALDIVGLSWLTRLVNVAWRSGTVPVEWQTGVVVPIFKKRGLEGVLQLSGYHTAQPPRERLFQGAGKEAPADCQTSASVGTMWIPSWPWNSGPALYPCRVVGEG